MKQFEFLFNHYPMFVLVWVSVGLDTVTGIIAAIVEKKFVWNLLSLWIQKILTFTLMMVAANVVEHYISMGGHNIEGFGLVAIAGTYILQELKSLEINLNKIWPKPTEL